MFKFRQNNKYIYLYNNKYILIMLIISITLCNCNYICIYIYIDIWIVQVINLINFKFLNHRIYQITNFLTFTKNISMNYYC